MLTIPSNDLQVLIFCFSPWPLWFPALTWPTPSAAAFILAVAKFEFGKDRAEIYFMLFGFFPLPKPETTELGNKKELKSMPFITYLSGLLTAQMLSDDHLISGVEIHCEEKGRCPSTCHLCRRPGKEQLSPTPVLLEINRVVPLYALIQENDTREAFKGALMSSYWCSGKGDVIEDWCRCDLNAFDENGLPNCSPLPSPVLRLSPNVEPSSTVVSLEWLDVQPAIGTKVSDYVLQHKKVDEYTDTDLYTAKAWDDILNRMGNLLPSPLAAVEISHVFSFVRILGIEKSSYAELFVFGPAQPALDNFSSASEESITAAEVVKQEAGEGVVLVGCAGCDFDQCSSDYGDENVNLWDGILKVNGSREVSSRLNFHFGLQRLGFLRAALGTGTWAEGESLSFADDLLSGLATSCVAAGRSHGDVPETSLYSVIFKCLEPDGLYKFTLYAVDTRGRHSELSTVTLRTACPLVDDSKAEEIADKIYNLYNGYTSGKEQQTAYNTLMEVSASMLFRVQHHYNSHYEKFGDFVWRSEDELGPRKAHLILRRLEKVSSHCSTLLRSAYIQSRTETMPYLFCRSDEVRPPGMVWYSILKDTKVTCEEKMVSMLRNTYGESKGR
ncbi:hypothetical protein WISP_86251 [Willisornis vidua]|uniref:ASTN2 protein n=1 Tax=Willisornis vidua TaxID=1566151 RepID=A0ABQ9D362_9PASS|nr:hypothetical protein WISP_86251 [Willisornis vidua]